MSAAISRYFQIGDNLKKIRLDLNENQIEFSRRLGIARSTYSNYENNNRTPDEKTINDIAQKLGVSINELLGIEALRSIEINLLCNATMTKALEKYPAEVKNKVINVVDKLVLSPFDDIQDVDVFSDDDIARFYLNTHIVLALQEYKSELRKFNYFTFFERSRLKEILNDNEYPKQDIQLDGLMIDHQKKLLDTKNDIHNAINAFEQWFLGESDDSQDDIYSKDIIDRLEKHVVKYDKKRIDL